MIQIDREKCTGCGLCVKDCFPENLRLADQKAQPGGDCFMCGHCIAICPTGAVSTADPDYSMAEVEEYRREDFQLEPRRLLNFIRFRRSVRRFAARPVETETIREILEAGRYTQTASNRQDLRYLIVREQMDQVRSLAWESLYQLALSELKLGGAGNPYAAQWKRGYDEFKQDPTRDILFFNAPVLLVVLSESKWNGCLAAESVELMANASGLGVLFSGFIERAIGASPELRTLLGIKGETIAACMIMGYPAVSYRRTVPRKPAAIDWK